MRVKLQDVGTENKDNNDCVDDDDFTEEDFRANFPAASLLNKIHFDHVYTTTKRQEESSKETSDSTQHNVTQDSHVAVSTQGKTVHSSCLVYKGLQESVASIAKSKPAKLEAKQRSKTQDSDMSSLNAESIQQVFQNMINMTSLTPMADQEQGSGSSSHRINKIKLVDKIPDSSTLSANDETSKDENAKKMEKKESEQEDKNETSKPENEKKKDRVVLKKVYKRNKCQNEDPNPVKTGVGYKAKNKIVHKDIEKTDEATLNVPTKITNPPTDDTKSKVACREVDSKEWQTRVAEHEMNTLLRFTAEVLAQQWGEYLAMSAESIRQFEVEAARKCGMVPEVVDMLEDKDRYVWQLIEELTFF